MKRWIALTVGAVAMFIVAARPIAAAPRAPAPGDVATAGAPSTTVPSDALGLSLSQLTTKGLAVTIDAGASESHDLLVSNHTPDLRLTVKLTATDATGNLGSGPAGWLAFADDVVQLEPHAVATVPMTVAIPHDTQPGPALAHVAAAVESAVAAADGAPASGTARATFPLSIVVSGAATAQVAIVDVHRVDKDSRHQLAVVLRNFGNEVAHVKGEVRAGSDHPQTLPLEADLVAARDTTVNVEWKNAPAVGVAVDLAIHLAYGNGDVASWSSQLGGPPTTLVPSDPGASPSATPTTVETAATPRAADASATATPKPWWQSGPFPALIVLAVLAAAGWFVVELRRSGRRDDIPMYPGYVVPAPSNDAAVELAKQLVRLTEVIVELATREDARARSPDVTSPWFARAGPASDDRAPPVTNERPPPVRQPEAPPRSAPVTPSAEPRPETETRSAPDPGVDAREALLGRLRDLDRQRRELRTWMDEEAAAETPTGSAPSRDVFVDRPDRSPDP